MMTCLGEKEGKKERKKEREMMGFTKVKATDCVSWACGILFIFIH